MLRTKIVSTMIGLPIVILAGCTIEPGPDTEGLELRVAPTTTRGFAIEGNIGSTFPLGDICVLHLFNDGEYTGLVVSRDDDEPPRCGALEPYLSGDDRLLEWNTADAVPITDLNALQNLSGEYDQASGREVDYFTLTGPLREWLWGATYDNGGTLSVTGLGSTCVVFVETDAGDTIGLVESEQNGACPNIGAFTSGFHTVQILAEDTHLLDNAAAESEITNALYPGGTVEYRVADAPLGLLYGTSLGGTFEGVTFTDDQAVATLELANNGSFELLDDTVPLNVRAAQSIVAHRPLATIDELGALYWVGPSALTRLRDFQCPEGTQLEDWECVPEPALLGFGEDCLGVGGAACESGICTTSWDGYFCYYTACAGTCETVEDCEQQAIAAGFAPQDVLGSMWCSNDGVCDLTYLQAGGVTCE